MLMQIWSNERRQFSNVMIAIRGHEGPGILPFRRFKAPRLHDEEMACFAFDLHANRSIRRNVDSADDACRPPTDLWRRLAEDANACRFFILGVLDGASMATGAKTPLGPLCITPGVPGSTLVAAVKKTMGEDLASNPEDRSLAAAGAVVAIVMNAFPCQNPE